MEKTIKFYDVKGKKPARVPVSKVSYITRSNRRGGKVKIAIAVGPYKNKLYKIIERVK